MPELPEVESVRRSLLPHLLGKFVARVIVGRADIVLPATAPDALPLAMLQGQRLTSIERRGKQLIVRAESGQAIGVHLGMTGQCLILAPGQLPRQTDHIHMRWQLVDDTAGSTRRLAHDLHTLSHSSELLFRDPRRFGELRAFATAQAAEAHMARLGPDALTITADELYRAVHHSNRAIKAALLDQSVLAGVGNIYADEALFAAQIRPGAKAHRLSRQRLATLAEAIRQTLLQAVEAGGSTLRDYLDADGKAGVFAMRHKVYGRGGQTCLVCGGTLSQSQIAQRTTVHCPVCQRP